MNWNKVWRTVSVVLMGFWIAFGVDAWIHWDRTSVLFFGLVYILARVESDFQPAPPEEP